MEYTSPYMPQNNGEEEHRIDVLKNHCMSMKEAANLTQVTMNSLWTEGVRSANAFYNISVGSGKTKTPYKKSMGERSKLYKHLVQFGRVAYVTKSQDIKRN